MKRIFVWLSAVVLSVGLVACQQAEEEVLPTIAETAVEAGVFENLVAALTAAELVGTFDDAEAGPFTVFAPNDQAFGDLIATVNVLLGDLEEGDEGFIADLDDLVAAVGIDYITDVLLYHVVSGAFFAQDVVQVTGFNTLLDDYALTVTVGEDVVLEGVVPATIIDVDIEASNGVIHVIDFVLLPYLPEVLAPQ